MASEIIASTPDHEIVTSRIINVPRNLVYEAWANPNILKNWWGPKGFTNTFHEFDLRPGGKWNFVMHGPDKGNYPNSCEFTKVDKPNLIAWKRHSKPLFQVLVTFDELPGEQTKIVFKMIFGSAEECNKIKKHVVDKNEENLDKLESELAKMIS